LQPLSEERAKVVLARLQEFGVSRSRLSSVGVGGGRPVIAFEDHDNWWKNRRVEFILIK
jgi:outer membrane protein OmpA-like peptidoglycan-associated protein